MARAIALQSDSFMGEECGKMCSPTAIVSQFNEKPSVAQVPEYFHFSHITYIIMCSGYRHLINGKI